MFHSRIISLSILALLGSVSIVAAGSDHPDPETVRAAFEHRGASLSAASESSAAAPKPSPLLPFSMLGTGTAADPTDGTCSGATCDASGGQCICIQIQGNLNATQVGNAPFTASVTVNINDCTNTGTSTSMNGGFCCFGDGVLSATTGSGKSVSTLAMSFTGPVCNDPNADAGNGGDTNVQGGFIILAASSSGKFQQSGGAGQINLLVTTANNVYLAGNGVLQVVSPF